MKNIWTACLLLSTISLPLFASEEEEREIRRQPHYVLIEEEGGKKWWIVPSSRSISKTRKEFFKSSKNMYFLPKYQKKDPDQVSKSFQRAGKTDLRNATLYLERTNKGSKPDKEQIGKLATTLTFEKLFSEEPDLLFAPIEVAWRLWRKKKQEQKAKEQKTKKKPWSYKCVYEPDKKQFKKQIEHYENFFQEMEKNIKNPELIPKEKKYLLVKVKQKENKQTLESLILISSDYASVPEASQLLEEINKEIGGEGEKKLHFYKKKKGSASHFSTKTEPILEVKEGKIEVKKRGCTLKSKKIIDQFEEIKRLKHPRASEPATLTILDLLEEGSCKLSAEYLAKMEVIEEGRGNSPFYKTFPPIETPEELYSLGLYKEAWKFEQERNPYDTIEDDASSGGYEADYSLTPSEDLSDDEFTPEPESRPNKVDQVALPAVVPAAPKPSSNSSAWSSLFATIPFAGGALLARIFTKNKKKEQAQTEPPSESEKT